MEAEDVAVIRSGVCLRVAVESSYIDDVRPSTVEGEPGGPALRRVVAEHVPAGTAGVVERGVGESRPRLSLGLAGSDALPGVEDPGGGRLRCAGVGGPQHLGVREPGREPPGTGG